MVPFLDALKSGSILIMDGAMGTQLAARGGITGPLSNFECPELVKAVHIDYKNAGANIILANTFAGNRIALEHAGMADRLEDINRLGVEICRNAVGDSCYVCGDIGSTGKFMELSEYTDSNFTILCRAGRTIS